jgi:hypothetical protein
MACRGRAETLFPFSFKKRKLWNPFFLWFFLDIRIGAVVWLDHIKAGSQCNSGKRRVFSLVTIEKDSNILSSFILNLVIGVLDCNSKDNAKSPIRNGGQRG